MTDQQEVHLTTQQLASDMLPAFVAERIAGMPQKERPTTQERQDIERRLLAAHIKACEAAQKQFRETATHTEREDIGPTTTGHLARCWPGILAEWRAENAERLAARSVLFEGANREPPDELATLAEAEGRLSQAVREVMPEARKAVTVPADLAKLGERDGMYALDAALADFIASRWDAKTATFWRDGWRGDWRQGSLPGSPPLWNRWADTLRLPRVLARVLWAKTVRAQIERERLVPPAWTTPVAHNVAALCWVPGRQLELLDNDQGATLKSAEGKELATVPSLRPGDLMVMQNSVKALGSITGHRAIRWLAIEGHRQVLARKPDPRIVAVDGGLAGFAELIGEKGSKSASDRVHNVLDAGQAFHSKWPGGEIAGLWTYGIRPHAPGRRAEMQVVLGVPLLPHYTRGDFLVPIVSLPGFVGRENEWAAQASLQFLVTAALVEHREELVTEGGANLSRKFERLAEQAGLPRALLNPVIERWCSDGSDGPAFLERVGHDRYHMADNATYGPARRHLIGAGERSLKNSKRGRAGAARRQRRGKC